MCHFTAAGKYSPYHCSSPLQLLLVRPLGWTLSYKTEKTWKDKCSKCNLRTPTQLLSKWKLWTILTSYLISRISEFTYWWSDNPHPVLMDESNGFCNGMEIIQTCQWSDVIFCTRSDSKWVSRHCFLHDLNDILSLLLSVRMWLPWGQDFIHYFFLFQN